MRHARSAFTLIQSFVIVKPSFHDALKYTVESSWLYIMASKILDHMSNISYDVSDRERYDDGLDFSFRACGERQLLTAAAAAVSDPSCCSVQQHSIEREEEDGGYL